MRLAGILLVIGIIGFFWSRRGSTTSNWNDGIEEVEGKPTPALVSPSSTPGASKAQPATSGLRQPIDRTRSVLDQVKARNGDGAY